MSTKLPDRQPAEIVRVPFMDGHIETVLVDGEPGVVIRPTLDAMGLDADSQLKKLKRKSWATTVMTTVVADDGKVREMATVNLDTWSMLLANIDEHRVAEAARPLVIDYQKKSAQALRQFWTQGGAINPAATDEQLDALEQQIEERRIRRALGLVQLIAAMDESVDPKWKRSRQLHHYAEAAGEIAEIPAEDRALLVETYLKDRGLSRAESKSVRSSLGRKLALAYEMQHGEKPKDSIGLVDGRERSVKSYTEADRPMFDKVWDEFYADRYPAQQRLGEAS
ncbi:phage antirepressor N-terminal domain-containing protein [Streptomyces sp. TUS-ST3]|uniref:phage antirepressor N-terminal domain-containing protein n=1 Tax=Streptomyces sp. TUS-ST3 TaxID=3025591 RepID=UPI0024E05378|nr:phage antirepressor N-terminal domain-containing protein [Streptomyces sp. TUS-ST3]